MPPGSYCAALEVLQAQLNPPRLRLPLLPLLAAARLRQLGLPASTHPTAQAGAATTAADSIGGGRVLRLQQELLEERMPWLLVELE